MRKNIEKVIEAFQAGKRAGGDSCSTDGSTIYSYQMPIARRLESGCTLVLAYQDAPTPTTKAQVRAVERMIDYAKAVPAAQLAPGYKFRDLAGEGGRIGTHASKRRYGIARPEVPPTRKSANRAPRVKTRPVLRLVK